MTNINQEVQRFIDNSPFIKRALSNNLINKRALAYYIIKETQLDGTVDAVISAIRRYNIEKYDNVFIRAQKMVRLSEDLSTRSNITRLTLAKNIEIQKLIPKFFKIIQYDQGEVLRIIQADESIKVLINEKNNEKIIDILPKKKITLIDENLAEINLRLNPQAKETPGVLATIANEVALSGVNIVEVLSCFPELLLFIGQNDLLKAYDVLYQLCNSSGK